jgi:hypothetical protein
VQAAPRALGKATARGAVKKPGFASAGFLRYVERYHFFTAAVDTPPDIAGRDGTRWISSWILLSRSKQPLEVVEIRQWTLPPDDRRAVWTDDHVY